MKTRKILFQLLVISLTLFCGNSSYAQDSRKVFKEVLNQGLDVLDKEPEIALKYIDQAYDLASGAKDFWAMSLAMASSGYINFEGGSFNLAYLNYLDALEAIRNADTLDLSNTIIILNELAMIQSFFDNHIESIEYGKEAFLLTKKYVRLFPEHAEKYNQLGWLVEIPFYSAVEYLKMGDYNTAVNILDSLWEGVEDKGNVSKYAFVLNEMGLAQMHLKEYEKAKAYFNLIIWGNEIDTENLAIAQHNLGDISIEKKEFDKAEKYFLKALELKRQVKNYESEFVSLVDLGKVYFYQEEFRKAIERWEVGVLLIPKFDDTDKFEIYEWIGKAYDSLGRHELAKTYHLFFESKEKEFRNSSEWIKKEDDRQSFRSLLSDLERTKTINSVQGNRTLLIVVFTIAAVIITLLILAYRKKQKQKKLYQQLGDILLDDES